MFWIHTITKTALVSHYQSIRDETLPYLVCDAMAILCSAFYCELSISRRGFTTSP